MLKILIIITIIKVLKITLIQVMIQPHNRGIPFSQYISALAILDTLGLLIGELLFSLAAPSSTPIKLSTKGLHGVEANKFSHEMGPSDIKTFFYYAKASLTKFSHILVFSLNV